MDEKVEESAALDRPSGEDEAAGQEAPYCPVGCSDADTEFLGNAREAWLVGARAQVQAYVEVGGPKHGCRIALSDFRNVESLAASDGRAGPIVDDALRIVFFIALLVQALIERELRRAMRERGIHAHHTDKTAFDPW